MKINEGGRKFPVEDSRDRTHKNLIYHKMVIGTCPKDGPSDREEKYSFSQLEKTGSGLTEEFQTVIKTSAWKEIKDRDRIIYQENSLPLFKKELKNGKKTNLNELQRIKRSGLWELSSSSRRKQEIREFLKRIEQEIHFTCVLSKIYFDHLILPFQIHSKKQIYLITSALKIRTSVSSPSAIKSPWNRK